ncbi:MAG: Rne/Rng family ribonuclease [Myxococcales bacterium]|nr:Rne/Rng family ribonuclease [Myxococcales bacterium]
MGSILVINAAGRETRVALVENGHIAEFYLERKKDRGIVGNIYKGRVVRVLPGMQAAFVDIGEEKAAFLYVSDVFYDPEFARAQFDLTEGEHGEPPEEPEVGEIGESTEESLAQAAGQELSPEPAEPSAPEGSTPERTVSGEFEALAVPASAAEPAAPPDSAAPPPAPPVELGAPSAETAPKGSEVVAAALAETALPRGSEVVAAALAEAAPAGERRAPRDSQREKFRRDRERGRRDEEKPRPRKSAKIEELLKIGQEVLVQVSKEPIGTKGARLTTHISIPGRQLVFMPTVDHVGISRRIANEKERRRLREIVDRLRPPGTGFIVRTVAEAVPQEKLEADIRFLIEVWNETVRKNEKQKGPGMVQPELDLILRATRDLFAQDIEQLVVDDRDEYERVSTFVAAQDPALKSRVSLHDNQEPIFDAYGIEHELHRAMQRKVWLKSGGYLIIDQAEALTAVDVNSGRYVGKKSLEETITKINVEAAKEIVYQLRLRNIGGIIICDFIDMEKPQNRDKVFKTLQEALGRDKAKTNVLRISELGLVEMTRKRVRESIGRVLHEDCPYCGGNGYVKTSTTVCYEIFRELRREAPSYRDPILVISCGADVAMLLQGEEREELRHLMDRFNKTIQVKTQPNFHREQYEIYGRSSQGAEHKLSSSGEDFDAAGYGGTRRPPERPEPRGREGRKDRRDRNRGGGRPPSRPSAPPPPAREEPEEKKAESPPPPASAVRS